jgi:phosphoribosylanthranilate isomerase
MRDHDNIADVATFAPDYMGFIFYEKSPRFVGADFRIPVSLPSSINRVGVFVNEDPGAVVAKASTIGFDHIQLHGNEPVGQCRELRSHGLKVIKVFSVDDSFDFADTSRFRDHVDYFLFDTRGQYFGGNAKKFNWEILKQYDQEVPFFLSGGLSAENIGSISMLVEMNLYALDINSGVEEYPGMKSMKKIDEILSKVKEDR